MSSFGKRLTICILSTTVLISTIPPAEGRIKVLSTYDDATVYIVHEKPIIMNIDSPEKGILITANPTNACRPVSPPPPIPINASFAALNSSAELKDADSGDLVWILLVSWSAEADCSLRIKAESAANAGYTVVLFQDPSIEENIDDTTPLLSPLTSLSSTTASFDLGWSDLGIYACTINPEDWEILKTNFTSDDYYLSFEDSSSMSGWFTYFIVGVLAIGAAFFTIGLSYVLVQLLILILLWIRESVVSRVQQMRRDRRRRLPASQLKKIPIQQWNSDMLEEICSICLETFGIEDRVRILPCSHVFHQVCIDKWLLTQRRTCPNCKRKIVFPDENRESDSSSDDERTPLLRRSSSTRGSDARSTPSQQQHNVSEHQTVSGIHRFLPATFTSGHAQSQNNTSSSPSRDTLRESQQERMLSLSPSLGSSINASVEDEENTPTSDNCQVDLKNKVDQLCARMESVGKKIKKKVKASQAAKQENDSSSDMSTSIQPVLVSVTVEPNHIPDNDCDLTSGESQLKEQPSGSNLHSHPQPPEKKTNEFTVKVVPDCPTSPINMHTGNSNQTETGETRISTDLNA